MEAAPYLRIAAALRQRISEGDLRPGDRVPSTRQLVRDWQVAMATATKAMAVLRQQGLVETRVGAGTVVSGRPAPPSASGTGLAGLTREHIVAAGISLADAEGLAALSMRRLAADLDVGVMSLYRHVGGRDDLVTQMVRSTFLERRLPAHPPDGWRAMLELVSRLQWDLYRRHLWTAETVSLTRPLLIPEAMAHTEWTLQALDGLGLSTQDCAREALALPAFVRGLALSRMSEAAAERTTGLTTAQWWLSLSDEVDTLLASGRFPRLATLHADVVGDFDGLFEYGLARHLDGLARLVGDSS